MSGWMRYISQVKTDRGDIMSTAIKPTKLAFKKAEAEWYNYYNTLKEIAKLREEIVNPFQEFKDENTGGGKSNIPGRPTESIATRLTTHKQLNYLVEVVDAIEQVYNSVPDNYKKLIRLRYWNRNSKLTWDGIAMQFEKPNSDETMSVKQVQRWRDEIIQATIELLGWR
jgi:RinA family phage transcriptional activator